MRDNFACANAFVVCGGDIALALALANVFARSARCVLGRVPASCDTLVLVNVRAPFHRCALARDSGIFEDFAFMSDFCTSHFLHFLVLLRYSLLI